LYTDRVRDNDTDTQVAPEERRPVTEDGEAASTHEPARTYDEEVLSTSYRISVHDVSYLLPLISIFISSVHTFQKELNNYHRFTFLKL